jgi:uncharacterized repeat protein (TIGR01451 family)
VRTSWNRAKHKTNFQSAIERFSWLAAVAGLLILSCACAQQAQPTTTIPADKALSAETAILTRAPVSAPLPSPLPSIAPASLPSIHVPTITPPGSSAQLVCRQHERSVDCDLGDVRSGNTATVTLDLSASRVETEAGLERSKDSPSAAAPPTIDLALQAESPSSVVTGQPFTITYTITNRGALDASGVWFEDEVPSDLNLIAYAPALPHCKQQGNAFTCHLRTLDSSKSVTFTLVITGYGAQQMLLELDPLLPGWPVCFVVKERTWQHIVYCEIGRLGPGQVSYVQLGLVAIGTQERTTTNTASIVANEIDLNPLDNTSSTTITIQASGEPGQE